MDELQDTKELELDIPTASGDLLKLILKPGDRFFVVGTNGSGKSALIQHITAKKPGNYIERIPAHRRTWFHSDSVDITAKDRSAFATNDFHQEMEDQARWTDVYAQQRLSSILFDLVDSENRRARRITQYVDSDDFENARKTSDADASPFEMINELLGIGTLSVNLEYSDRESILARHQNASKYYGISQMSDGERSAVSMAAKVLTVVPGTILLIDEPERHLHPSISKPFLTALFQCRRDCAFVVSTNDIALPTTDSEARVLLVRSCLWRGSKADSWDIDLLEPHTDLPEDLKRAILGSRKRILFVEGDSAGSLDLPLYSALFPGVSIVPKGGCVDVQRAVRGLRDSENYHHVEAFGLIDRDNREDDEVEKLARNFVFALDVCSVESLYYCTDSIYAVAQRQAESLGDSASELFEAAKERALVALRKGSLAEEMAARRCERKLQDRLLSKSPGWKTIMEFPRQSVEESIEPLYQEEVSNIRDLIAKGTLDALVARYPLRYSNVFNEIASALRLDGRETYERMLLSRVRANPRLVKSLKKRIESLSCIVDYQDPSPSST